MQVCFSQLSGDNRAAPLSCAARSSILLVSSSAKAGERRSTSISLSCAGWSLSSLLIWSSRQSGGSSQNRCRYPDIPQRGSKPANQSARTRKVALIHDLQGNACIFDDHICVLQRLCIMHECGLCLCSDAHQIRIQCRRKHSVTRVK